MTAFTMDQLTVIVQLLSPTGMLQLAGTEKEVTAGGFGAHWEPFHVLPVAQTALDGRVPNEVPLSEISKILRPKSSAATKPALDARVEICAPSWVNDGVTGLSITQLSVI